MSEQKQNERAGLWMLFPEIIGISILTLCLPLPLVHMLLSGQVLAGVLGFILWFAALFFTVRFIWLRQYHLA
jgi:hypothetical protein